jgi:two-component system sensor histidine kinase VicK
MENDKINAYYSGREVLSGNWRLSLDMRQLSICPGVRKMLALPEEGRNDLRKVFMMIDSTQRWQLIRDFKVALRNRSSLETEVKITTTKGKVKWIRIQGILNYRRWGTPEKLLGIVEDITQKRTEESTVLSIVNHEMRVPLTIVKLNTQMASKLLMQNKKPDLSRLLNKSEFYINLMGELLEEYSSNKSNRNLEAGNYSVFNIAKLIGNITTEIRTMYSSHQFVTDIPVEMMVKANKYKIVQVMVNFLTNAVNYSPCSSRIVVGLTADNNDVSVTVQDQGIGLPLGTEEIIFEKFYRGNHNSTMNRKNKGLGLYLVKEIIQQHGGNVKATRADGKGTIFSFTLPRFHPDQTSGTLIR